MGGFALLLGLVVIGLLIASLLLAFLTIAPPAVATLLTALCLAVVCLLLMIIVLSSRRRYGGMLRGGSSLVPHVLQFIRRKPLGAVGTALAAGIVTEILQRNGKSSGARRTGS